MGSIPDRLFFRCCRLLRAAAVLAAVLALSVPATTAAAGGQRQGLDHLEPGLRDTVLEGWRLFQSPNAADGMACANCHTEHSQIISWAGAYPKVQVFDGSPHTVKTLRQVVLEALVRHTDLSDDDIEAAADPLVAYITWWADGQPVRPGISEAIPPPDDDLGRLARCAEKGKRLLTSVGPRGCGTCHLSLGGATPEESLTGTLPTFPRLTAVGRAVSFDTFLREHARATGTWLGSHEITEISAFLAGRARGMTIRIGEPLDPDRGKTP